MSADAIPIGTWRRGIALWCLSVFLWAVIEVIGGLVPPDHSAYQVVWMRYGTHLLFMLIAFGPRRKTQLVRTRRLGLQVSRALLMLGMPVAFILALNTLPIHDVWAAFWVAPLLALVLSIILLRERIRPSQWIVALIGFAGALILLQPDRAIITWATVWPLAMALCFSLYLVMTQMLHGESTLTNLLYTALCVFVPLSAGLSSFWRALAPRTAAMMIAIGLIGYCALYTLDKAIEAVPVSALTPFTYAQPIWVMLIGAILLGQTPGPLAILGALIIVGSLVYVVARETNAHRHM